tara:strand:+ start:899 stop:1603 length:705 start_codon:yes stop_codon:yes gene_type:complete
MLRTLKNKAFSIIELLVVIVIIIVIVVIAYPQISKWQEAREVRKEVNSLISYLKEKKSEVDEGKYAMSIVRVGNNNSGSWWTMSNEEWARQMKVPAEAVTAQGNLSRYDNKSILNHSRTCPGAYEGYNREGTQYWTKQSTAFNSSKLRFHPNVHMCISKNAIIHPFGSGETVNGIPGKVWVMLCSIKNTTDSGSKKCNVFGNFRTEHMYVIQITRELKFDLWKYNVNQAKWIKK